MRLTMTDTCSRCPALTVLAAGSGAFGSDQITISPVPETVDKPRPGMGHHHLGVDTDCLPAGEVIPKASPWIHFGTGKTVIEMQLSPGPHKFALQLGDDQHRTIQGLCQVINVTVAP